MRSPFWTALVGLVFAALLAGCGSTTELYKTQLDFVEKQDEKSRLDAEQRSKSYADRAAACPPADGSCVTAVAAFAAIADMQAANQPKTQLPALPRTGFDKVVDLARGVLPVLARSAVVWHQSDNSTEAQIAQYGFLEGIVRSSGETAVAITEAGPRIDVGGNFGDTYGEYVGGDQTRVGGNQGPTFGDDFTGADRTDVGNDQIGGDRTDNSGNIGNDNRIDSAGPYDNSDDGDDCDGECVPVDG